MSHVSMQRPAMRDGPIRRSDIKSENAQKERLHIGTREALTVIDRERINATLFKNNNRLDHAWRRWTYSFANTPLKAAHAPLAIAKMIHWDLRLMFDKSISLSSAAGIAGSDEGDEASMLL